MTRIIIAIILFFLTLQTRANDTLTTKFINSVYLTQVDSSFRFYNLYFNGKHLTIYPDDIRDLRPKDNNDTINAFLDYALTNSLADTVDLNWYNYSFSNAKVFSHNYEKFAPPEFIVVDSKLSKAKQRLEYTRQFSIINNWPKEDFSSFVFSKAIFSKDKTLALIRLSSHIGYTNPMGKSCLYLFKLVNDNWVKIQEANCILFTDYR